MDEDTLRAGALGGLWTALDVVASTGSTNADLLARADAAPEGQVLVAEEQTAGRGRLGRTWTSVRGASLTFSVLLRPAGVPAARRGWLPLLAGVAVASAVRSVAGGSVNAVLKWPNDVLVGDRKLAGILAEQSSDGSAVVIGVGVNVATPADALPVSPAGVPATSLLVEGSSVAREPLLLEVLRQFERRYAVFRADPDPVRTGLLDAYRSLCATLGRPVRVELPVGRFMAGVARDIDSGGRLLVADDSGNRPLAISAGDVIHVRLPEGGRIRCGFPAPRTRWRGEARHRESPSTVGHGVSAWRLYHVPMGQDHSLAAGEETVAVLHPHWKTLARPVLLTFVVVAVLLTGEVLIPGNRYAWAERLVLAAVAIVALMWWLVIPILAWRATVYELTTRRLRLRDGILTRSGRDIPLSRITDVSFRKGVLDRIFGCGTLVVESAGEHGELALTEIPRVEQVSGLLSQLMEDKRLHDSRLTPPAADEGGDFGGRPPVS